MKILERDEWSDEFFEEYRLFRNLIHQQIEDDFPLKLEDYEKFFASKSPFVNDFSWKAFVVSDGDVRLAQGILCWKKNSKVAHLGYLDLSNNLDSSKFLFLRIYELAKDMNFEMIKAPVDLNFFIKYRMKIAGTQKSFYGEPLYPDYYINHFKQVGLEIIGKWDTYKVDVKRAVRDFFKKRVKVNSLKQKGQVKVRSIRLNKWEEELAIIYDLFIKSYSEMPEFESISFHQFKFIYDDFKYIIQPWLSYIVEYNGSPVGFCINYVDPLPELKKVKNKKLSKFQKLILLAKLRLSFGTLLISYVGKIPGPDGEEVKGVQIKVSKKLTPFALFMNKVLVTYQNVDSPSRRSWDESVLTPYSEYVLFGKTLER